MQKRNLRANLVLEHRLSPNPNDNGVIGMAKLSLAGQWLAENDLSWNSNPKPQNNPKKTSPNAAPFFICALDRLAFDEKLAREAAGKRSGRQRRAAPGRKYLGLRHFVDHIAPKYSKDQCLLVPFGREGSPASIFVDGAGISAARYVCCAAHGHAPQADMVARHLCGRGHLSCVNPSHLAWGTYEENSRDRSLHWGMPRRSVIVDDEAIAGIRQDQRHPNIVAIEYGLPTMAILAIKSDHALTGYQPQI